MLLLFRCIYATNAYISKQSVHNLSSYDTNMVCKSCITIQYRTSSSSLFTASSKYQYQIIVMLLLYDLSPCYLLQYLFPYDELLNWNFNVNVYVKHIHTNNLARRSCIAVRRDLYKLYIMHDCSVCIITFPVLYAM